MAGFFALRVKLTGRGLIGTSCRVITTWLPSHVQNAGPPHWFWPPRSLLTQELFNLGQRGFRVPQALLGLIGIAPANRKGNRLQLSVQAIARFADIRAETESLSGLPSLELSQAALGLRGASQDRGIMRLRFDPRGGRPRPL